MEVRQALCVCPDVICRAVYNTRGYENAQELRLRAGKELSMLCGGEILRLGVAVSQGMLQTVLDRATRQSAYAKQDMLRAGFVTIPGGHRLGICGTAVVQNGEITTIRNVSSLCLRIARELHGIGTQCLRLIWTHPQSTLLIGPPGSGKTTLLRDVIRLLSVRRRVSVVDDRQEVAACVDGVPQFDLGENTDVLSAAPKGKGIELVLRAMNPQWIALDEITAQEDVQAICAASNCGVRFLATAHAACREELYARPFYRRLMEEKIFQNLVFLAENHSIRMERSENTC